VNITILPRYTDVKSYKLYLDIILHNIIGEKKMNKKLSIILLGFILTLLVFPLPYSFVTAQVGEEVRREESLIIQVADPLTAFGQTFNPFTALYGSLMFGGTPLMEPFIYKDTLTGGETFMLATGYEWLDENNVELYLHPDAKWNDGEAFTADDVIFTYNLILDNPELARPSGMQYVQDVTKVDENTILITIDGAAAGPRWNIANDFFGWGGGGVHHYVVPEHIWTDVDPVVFTNTEGDSPVFTGPYKIYQRAENFWVYRRDDNYWGNNENYPKWIVVKAIMAAETEINAWWAREIDWGLQSADTDLVAIINNTDTYSKVFWVPDACATSINMNNLRYPMNESEFRWAINYAINKQRIRDFVYKGYAVLADTPLTSTPAMQRWIDPSVTEDIKINEFPSGNPTLAIQMLEDLGFTKVDGWFTYPNGTRITLEILTPGTGQMSSSGDAVMEDLRAIGLDVVTVNLGWGPFITRWNGRDYDMVLGQTPCNYLDPHKVLSMQHTDAPSSGWFGNTEGYSNPQFDQLVEQYGLMRDDPNDPEVRAVVNQLLRIWMTDLPTVPITISQYTYSAHEYYWEGWPTKDNWYATPAMQGVNMLAIIPRLRSVVEAPSISYVGVWFTADVESFIGADEQVYGPYEEADFANIPKINAENFIDQGLATYQVPGLAELPEAISGLQTQMSGLSSDLSDLEDSVDQISSEIASVSSQMTMVTAAAVIEAIAIIILLILLMRK
jgi:peptide/nickel transport system substrate-binding protein